MIEVNVGSVGSKCSIGSTCLIGLIGYFYTMQPLEHIQPFQPFQQVFQSTNQLTPFFFKFLINCNIAVIKKTPPIIQLI